MSDVRKEIIEAYTSLMCGFAVVDSQGSVVRHETNISHMTIEFPTLELSRAIIRHYASGQISCENEYRNQELHGCCRGWFRSGQLWWSADYRKGQLHGWSNWFDRRGQTTHLVAYNLGEVLASINPRCE